MSKMKFLFKEDGLDYYLFTPSICKLYEKEQPGRTEPVHRYSLTHKMHMIHYVLTGGYNILYVKKDGIVVSYIIFTKCKENIVSGSSHNDYYTIFLYTYPEYRGQGLASKMADVMINKIGLSFRFFYKTINKDNYSSIKVAEKNGFKKVSDANKVGLLNKIIPVENGAQYLYRLEK